jgi:hypothetical protein
MGTCLGVWLELQRAAAVAGRIRALAGGIQRGAIAIPKHERAAQALWRAMTINGDGGARHSATRGAGIR